MKTKASAKKTKETPLMAQYNRIKAKYPDAILLFRVGDFYETFSKDAVITSKILGIVLTKRANGAASHIELAGFPHHALDTYLPKLVKAGYRVAICEQLEDPKLAKKIVKRGVTELITPGVAHNEKILDHKQSNYLASVFIDRQDAGITFLDISTGEFLMAQGNLDYIENLLQNFKPSEIIFPKNQQQVFNKRFGNAYYTYTLDDWVYTGDYARETLLSHFETSSLKGFGVEELELGIRAAGATLHYLKETEHPQLSHINKISRLIEDQYVWIDKFTARNLELLQSAYDTGTPLIQVLDHTITPMGSRLLKKWIVLPLTDPDKINERLSVVEFFIKNQQLSIEMRGYLNQIGDMERLISKVALNKANPRDISQLYKALKAVHPIRQLCLESRHEALVKTAELFNPCNLLVERIEMVLVDDPPVQVNKGDVIKEGVSDELDELRQIAKNSKDYILKLQQKESERTGIPSLKVGYNNVFGYYLEVTNTHKSKVPSDWIRKQTLVNAERYVTEELKLLEEKIIGAEEKILGLEEKLFQQLLNFTMDYIKPVQLNSQLIARLDCLLCFAEIAERNDYRKPIVDRSLVLEIKAGRHPVIEQFMPPGEEYVPNDLYLDNESQQIIVITGPNMSGKSALLRQTALIVLMAQMGSFVPASAARIGIIDKIFTRTGASDNISSGESTFMVEMTETASILNNISERSIILLDEIGRGTSTYDGISIAWSIAEYLHNNPVARPKTLFATHYHELNELATKFKRIKNFNVSTREVGNKVIFLRKLLPGGSKHSFGIHVAKMAGMPPEVVRRANEILHQLEKKGIGSDLKNEIDKLEPAPFQLSIFDNQADPVHKEIIEMLETLNINAMTPIEALLKLSEIKEMLNKKS